MGFAMARQEAAIACRLLAEAVQEIRPKYAEHPGIIAPAIDSGGFRAPEELWLTFKH